MRWYGGAVGYIRVSTDMQAAEGLSLEAQQAAIERFCESTSVEYLSWQSRPPQAAALCTQARVAAQLR